MDLIAVVAVVLAAIGVALVLDLARVRREDPAAIGTPERIQLVTGIAAIIFTACFLVGRGAGEEAPPAPEPTLASADDPEPTLTGLTTAARLPALQAAAEKPDRGQERRRPRPDEDADQPPETTAPVEETTTPTTTTTTTPTTPTTTTPVPTTPTEPPPEPPPADDDVPFDSRE